MNGVTVIVCTHNRCHLLAKALESVAASEMPAQVTWEVLVVDNNSSDRTRQVVQGYSERYPGRFRYLFEPRPGKSHALNSGVCDAHGAVLAFMDDDLTVEPTWLRNLTASLEGNEWAGTGGRTLFAEAFSPPAWMAVEGSCSLGGVLAAQFDLGDQAMELKVAPFGANMALRKSMFEKYGPFRTDLGPSPNREIPRPNEDTEFGRRVMSGGDKFRYEPAAIARHPVPLERLRKDYFLAWWFDYGRARVRELGKRSDILGMSRHYFTVSKILAFMAVPSVFRWMFTIEPSRRFFRKCWVWMAFGQIFEARRQSRKSDVGPAAAVGH